MKTPFSLSLLIVSILLLLLGSCASIPRDEEKTDSLILLYQTASEVTKENRSAAVVSITLSGPVEITLSIPKRGVPLAYEVAPPGTYQLSSIQLKSKRVVPVIERKEITLHPSSVLLLPWSIPSPVLKNEISEQDLRFLPPGEQKEVSALVTSHFRFRSWQNTDYFGFGAYSPRTILEEDRLTVLVETVPSGAEIIIDGEDWGKSPIETKLSVGKHFIRTGKDGYQPLRRFFSVDREGPLTFTLETGEDISEIELRYHLLSTPFVNIGDPEFDYLASVFSDTIGRSLMREDYLTVTTYPEDLWVSDQEAASIISYGETTGAQLIITGRYYARGEELFIHAILLDVGTELIKTSTTYIGKAGYEVFDSIDTMVEKFLTGVHKALPDAGKRVVEKRSDFDEEYRKFEERVAEQDIIDTRHRRENSLDAAIYYGAVPDSISLVTTGKIKMRVDGPTIGLCLGYEHAINPSLSMVMRFIPSFSGKIDEEESQIFEFPLYIGPRYTFSTLNADIYFGLLAYLRYATAKTFVDETDSETRGPFFLVGGSADVGVKAYTHKSRDSLPSYFNAGILMGFPGYRVELGGEGSVFYPFEIWLYVGYGSRL